MTASKKDYDAAKSRLASCTDAQHADPTPEMLADVDVIREYESAASRALHEEES